MSNLNGTKITGGALHASMMAAGVNVDPAFNLTVPNAKYLGVTMVLQEGGVLVVKGAQRTLIPLVNFKAIHLAAENASEANS